MAELVDLGKHCYLETCKKLDYTPFYCRQCEQHFCAEHRFLHGCVFSRTYDPATESTSSSNPLKPFLCSKKNCFLGENIKIVCPFCKLNFCLQHRHAAEHDCQHVTVEKDTDPVIADRLRRMHELLGPLIKKGEEEKGEERCTEKTDPSPLEQSRMDQIDAMKAKLSGKNTPVLCSSQPTPTKEAEEITMVPGLTLPEISAQQQKEDRIAVMRLKMANKGPGTSEKQILFVEWPGGRKPIFVQKSWTIGKAVSQARGDLKIAVEVKSICKRGSEVVLDWSDTVDHVFKEEDTLALN